MRTLDTRAQDLSSWAPFGKSPGGSRSPETRSRTCDEAAGGARNPQQEAEQVEHGAGNETNGCGLKSPFSTQFYHLQR